MNRQKFEEMIPLAALGKLTAQEWTEFQNAMADRPELATALREHEELVAGLWQSASPLRTMPSSVWNQIKTEITPPIPLLSKPSSTSFTIVPWLGWAAAVIITAIWFLTGKTSTQPGDPIADSQQTPTANTATPDKPGLSNRTPQSPAASRRRQKLFELRERLRIIRNADAASTASPRIIALRHPDSPRNDDPANRTQRLMDLLTMALQDDIQRLYEEDVALVIENGWPRDGLKLAPDDFVRHRNFPREQAETLGLLVSENNHFYDPASSTLWKPAPDGGGYLGELAPEDLDLTRFQTPPKVQPQDTEIRNANHDRPEGYVIAGANPGDQPTFVFSNVSSAHNTLSVVQEGRTIPLQANTVNPSKIGGTPLSVQPTSADGQAFPTQYVTSTFMLFTDFSTSDFGQSLSFNPNIPFEVINTSESGQQSVILTNTP